MQKQKFGQKSFRCNCGRETSTIQWRYDEANNRILYFIFCPCGRSSDEYESPEVAITNWRVGLLMESIQGEQEGLREVIEQITQQLHLIDQKISLYEEMQNGKL